MARSELNAPGRLSGLGESDFHSSWYHSEVKSTVHLGARCSRGVITLALDLVVESAASGPFVRKFLLPNSTSTFIRFVLVAETAEISRLPVM